TMRLYRLFELLGCRDRTTSSVAGGKVMGRINLNTMYDKVTFDAAVDANPGNHFTQADVDNVWNLLVARGLGNATIPGPPTTLNPNAQPFSSYNVPFPAGAGELQYKAGGYAATVTPGTPLFDVNPGAAGTHPMLVQELLHKVFGQ